MKTLALLVLLGGTLFAGDDSMESIRAAARARLQERHVDPAPLRKKIHDAIDQKMSDTGRTRDACAVDYGKDWLADRRGKLDAGNQKMWDDAAVFIVVYAEMQIELGPDLREKISQNQDDIVRRLEARE